ncbi:hypothetical protein D2T31_10855 [Sinirhodobacter populi]|uniref:Uncharacterized protein n=1 Tax=Paenirhodobacter populi TaxID=2306993 RepID=A0A443K9W7_9RHOB|nr:hypothetical protein [Sinirhodobacter populi]RWR29472.1 hypothetical protein D2T31_10855 [Sinirhodobacter populi]
MIHISEFVAALMRQAVGAPGNETPIMSLFREWVKLQDEEVRSLQACETGNGDTPECLAAMNAVIAVEAKIASTPAVDLRDYALKIAAVTNFGLWAVPPIYDTQDLRNEVFRLVAKGA